MGGNMPVRCLNTGNPATPTTMAKANAFLSKNDFIFMLVRFRLLAPSLGIGYWLLAIGFPAFNRSSFASRLSPNQ